MKKLARSDKEELALLLAEKERRRRTRKITFMYPEEGPLRRTLYVPHMKFFEATGVYRELAFMGANRSGKTEGVGGFITSSHLTGKYPAWWPGKRFDKPVRCWAAGKTAETTRDILQYKLMGPINDLGTGLIPGDDIVDFKKATGVPDAFESVDVRHVSGGVSHLGFKAYKSGRGSFEGTEQDFIWLDEEPDLGVYTECLMRTMTVNGQIYLTFTPLEGLSEVVMQFMPGGRVPEGGTLEGSRWMIGATWDDAPHLGEREKKELWASIPPYMRDARSKGIPALGSGAIYPIDEKDLLVDDFVIPPYWPKVVALDVGWNCTAALWKAKNPDTGVNYFFAEYKRGFAEPVVHVSNIQLRGKWIPCVGDPASRASSQKDGEKLIDAYHDLGLEINLADNQVEAGLFEVFVQMTSGKLKVFRSLVEWLAEFRIYRRDEKGHVVKSNDHLMDCMRYGVMSGDDVAKTVPVDEYLAEGKFTGIMMPLAHSEGAYDPLRF
jgi:phage terminase large subunit-like protein